MEKDSRSIESSEKHPERMGNGGITSSGKGKVRVADNPIEKYLRIVETGETIDEVWRRFGREMARFYLCPRRLDR